MYVGGEIAELAGMAQPEHRRGHGRPAGPPGPDRLAPGDRGGQGRAARGAATGRPGDPERGRPDRPPDGQPLGREVDDLRLRPRRRRSAPRPSSRPGWPACASSCGPTTAAARCRSRRWVACRSTTRWPPRPWVAPPACRSTRSPRASRSGWSAPHRVQVVRDGGGDLRRRHLQRLASIGRRRPRPAGRAAGPAWRGARARCSSSATRSGEGHRVVGEAAARTVDWLVVVGQAAAGIAEGALAVRPGAGAPVDGRRRRRRARVPAASTSRRRRRAVQGVARNRAGAARGRPRRRGRRASAADDRRADPGSPARLRHRGDPDGAVHPAAPCPRLRQADPPGRARRATTSRRARRRWAAC